MKLFCNCFNSLLQFSKELVHSYNGILKAITTELHNIVGICHRRCPVISMNCRIAIFPSYFLSLAEVVFASSPLKGKLKPQKWIFLWKLWSWHLFWTLWDCVSQPWSVWGAVLAPTSQLETSWQQLLILCFPQSYSLPTSGVKGPLPWRAELFSEVKILQRQAVSWAQICRKF